MADQLSLIIPKPAATRYDRWFAPSKLVDGSVKYCSSTGDEIAFWSEKDGCWNIKGEHELEDGSLHLPACDRNFMHSYGPEIPDSTALKKISLAYFGRVVEEPTLNSILITSPQQLEDIKSNNEYELMRQWSITTLELFERNLETVVQTLNNSLPSLNVDALPELKNVTDALDLYKNAVLQKFDLCCRKK